MKKEDSIELTKTPRSAEKNLQKLLDRYGLSNKLTVATVKDWIWNEKGDTAMEAVRKFQKKAAEYFSNLENTDELFEVMQIFTDAWNCFSHESLEGKSPNQVMQSALKENPAPKKADNQKMPDFIVGGHKMPWDEYWAMIKEMEKRQVPFKSWVENDVLPKYEKFLKAKLEDKTVEKHSEVAGFFFDRAVHVGFIEFDNIRKDFVQKEFPHWWPTHVLLSNLSEKEVLSSLQKLFQFISSTYGKDIRKFGFYSRD